MVNRSKTKVDMPERDPKSRVRHFQEVALGYTPEQAMEEARRCLQCRHKPCVAGCPVQVHIPEFIALVAAGHFQEAYEVIMATNRLPAICGRVCPQEVQCEQRCVRTKQGESVAIGRLERFVADWALANSTYEPREVQATGHRVAVVGSGPAGLACAGDLAGLGHDVTLFEAFHVAGGVLVYGIPEFRLPKGLVAREIDQLRQSGVTLMTNQVIGKTYTLDDLFEQGFEAVFIGSGAGLPRFLGIEGENLNGVYTANEFLTRVNLMQAYRFPDVDTPVAMGRQVCVVGGGNVAMDAARSAKRLGAQTVTILYRRSEAEMPAREEEVAHAKEEGIRFRTLVNPVRMLGTDSGWVRAVTCSTMTLGEPDASGRRRPIPLAGQDFDVVADTVIVAIGQSPNPLIKAATPQLVTQDWGGIIVDPDTLETSIPGVFAGGDVVTGAATVIQAMGAGKQAAAAIHKRLTHKQGQAQPPDDPQGTGG